MLVFAGDHGAAKAGVSAYPQDVTWQMVENFPGRWRRDQRVCPAEWHGLSVIDAGVAHDFGRRPGLINAKVAPGTANYIEQPAMTAEQCANGAWRGGRKLSAIWPPMAAMSSASAKWALATRPRRR
jgi:nicotinate-nucleotide--dimethylbenzimidazole phosphoribosyltransferase